MAKLDQSSGEPRHPSREGETQVEHEDLHMEWSVSVRS